MFIYSLICVAMCGHLYIGTDNINYHATQSLYYVSVMKKEYHMWAITENKDNGCIICKPAKKS